MNRKQGNLAARAIADACCGNRLNMCMYQLTEARNDRYGHCIQYEDEGLVTLTSFVWTIKPGTKFCFGGSVDCHF